MIPQRTIVLLAAALAAAALVAFKVNCARNGTQPPSRPPAGAKPAGPDSKAPDDIPLPAEKDLANLYRRIAADLKDGKPLTVTVYVALCDNVHQGIVKVPARLGNGDDARNNLYWGALYGLYGEFKRAPDYALVSRKKSSDGVILETVVFRKQIAPNAFWKRLGVTDGFEMLVVGKAYRGRNIGRAVKDFAAALFTDGAEELTLPGGQKITAGGAGHLAGFIGHNHLMDVAREDYPFKKITKTGRRQKGAFVLCCRSYSYFSQHILDRRVHNLVMTKSLMAPESYTVRYLLDAVAKGGEIRELRKACAAAYANYQKISTRAAERVFCSGD